MSVEKWVLPLDTKDNSSTHVLTFMLKETYK